MKPGGGKQKGAEFERDTCKKLSLWVSNGRHDDCFWRSAMSGGRATLARRAGGSRNAQDGDITSIRKEGMALCELFSMECKFYKDLNFLGLFCPTKTRGINEFWGKLIKSNPHKNPMLIAKQNRMDTVVVLSQRGAMLLGLTGKEFVIFPEHDAYLFDFDDFLLHAELQLQPRFRFKLKRGK